MSDLDALLQSYGPPTLLYLVCRALGLSMREAAARAGFSQRTGRKREREPWWPGLFAAVQARLRDADPTLLALVPEAIRTYEQALGEADRSVARDVLDRVFGRPRPRAERERAAEALPPLIVYERSAAEGDSTPPLADAGDIHRQHGTGSDV
jgi:hypothetical protein